MLLRNPIQMNLKKHYYQLKIIMAMEEQQSELLIFLARLTLTH
jgi:hypothetical protein